ncbi:hypothetical protein BFW01_g5654 [Lasiodiplodia theobromae]|nr:hypothetical protein BFW01_g5654 [Lasiodiplodia theobromae]
MLEFTAGSGAAELVFYLPPISSALSASTEYVQQCYSGNSSGACGNFVRSSIPTKVNQTAACPFDPKICKTQDSNILLDTGYLDTRDDFGINLKKTGRFSYRRVLHCAPLVTEGYQAKLSDINASAVRQDDEMFYFYGNTVLHNYTHRHPIGKWWKNFLQEEPGFTVTTIGATTLNGSWIKGSLWGWEPIEELRRPDSEVFIVFLSTNRYPFVGNSSDIWYSANTPVPDEDSKWTTVPLYQSDEAASPLGCAEQHQYCNPSLPDGENCTPLFGLDTRTMMITSMVKAGSLDSHSGNGWGLQGKIADDQWQLDVQKWHNISLARIQQRFVDTTTGSSDPTLREMLYPPPDEDYRAQSCHSQLIRSTAYTNFSILGLIIIFAVGGLIILLSWLLEPLTACRLAHEEAGFGSWRHCDEGVPVTKRGDQLGVIDMEDLAHPRLKAPPPLPAQLEEVALEDVDGGNGKLGQQGGGDGASV